MVDCAGKDSGGGTSTSSPKPDEWEMALDLPNNQVAPECLRSHIKEELRYLFNIGRKTTPFDTMPTTLRTCGVFARRSLPVVPSSPLAVWAGCPSLLRSFKLWIKGTNVVKWNSMRVTRSTVPRCEVQVVMITPGYALAPLTGTSEPANARENPGQSVLHSSDRRYG
ncbi:hypothetical protein KY284_011480 [Solanum tuberosum]|nr:hypothetical protein KY284_011480 [Solanum tuberosum]